jgi:NADPH-dependent 2,4-dienoyl-CoA reductase/sulfur reductase-like enzyme
VKERPSATASPRRAGAQRGEAERSPRSAGFVRVHAEYAADCRDEADVVVVGSGPCGAVVAKELAEAGRSVVPLEEGPPFTPADFELDGALSMARTMR